VDFGALALSFCNPKQPNLTRYEHFGSPNITTVTVSYAERAVIAQCMLQLRADYNFTQVIEDESTGQLELAKSVVKRPI
jgi:hypothetical protein